ncbi:MAG: hypothetical protein HF312_12015 [Ignavibacteria bacterium]|jgi:hypothetical protein|nr:hypothetical protein [Ignavibacteria bacterium]MCU7520934.1 hypothetical protein [Ignavibacteria bacterium]
MRNLIISLFIFLGLNYSIFPQTIPTATSADKGNGRGLVKDIGNNIEQISDFDGNLLLNFKTKLSLPNEMGGDFSVMYSNNVEHRAFMYCDPNYSGYMVNAPEWILGYKGYALQTLNFEIFNFIHPDSKGENVPLLVSGYHFSNRLKEFSDDYDFIQILMADGSKTTLRNVDKNQWVGLYVEDGNDKYGYAKVEINSDMPTNGCDNHYRRIWFYPGDGFVYYFEEEPTVYYGSTSWTATDPTAIYGSVNLFV